jgi:septal ring factor EnvC (AmiA/AmiB activator)
VEFLKKEVVDRDVEIESLNEKLNGKDQGNESFQEKITFLKLELQRVEGEKSAINNEKVEAKRKLEKRDKELNKS